MANWVFEQLTTPQGGGNLPGREPELLGTALQWDILLTVEEERSNGAPMDEALAFSFDHLHLKDALDDHGQPNQRKLWGQRGSSWFKDYRALDCPLDDSGLIQRSFPSFELLA